MVLNGDINMNLRQSKKPVVNLTLDERIMNTAYKEFYDCDIPLQVVY